ncbi:MULTISPECIES: glycosyltransferase family 2 protein [Pseudomonas]|uniref:glycosyltransferase family 2 protein n=1 Tax=Pseudomonas TaxID=286 RepID=UPI001CC9739C|nr:glycosyltransferase family 2 protein [Pseudomonas sp. P116]
MAILLCTYNGGSFLKDQLDSIAAQSHERWVVYASDDGSTDDTLETLQRYREAWGQDRLIILQGPGRGFSNNFLSVLGHACGRQKYYAFCDQDDYWHPTKLQRAVAWLKCQPVDTPALYCGRTRIVTETGEFAGLSPLFCKPPSFENALMQNLAGGNTMLINQAACSLLNMTPPAAPLVCHDWWTYLLITGSDGNVHYDPTPTLDYRQHSQNVIGANTSVKSRLLRVKRMFQGSMKEWNDANIAALTLLSAHLSERNVETFKQFERGRNAALFSRIKMMISSRFYRQTFIGNVGLALAILINKM